MKQENAQIKVIQLPLESTTVSAYTFIMMHWRDWGNTDVRGERTIQTNADVSVMLSSNSSINSPEQLHLLNVHCGPRFTTDVRQTMRLQLIPLEAPVSLALRSSEPTLRRCKEVASHLSLLSHSYSFLPFLLDDRNHTFTNYTPAASYVKKKKKKLYNILYSLVLHSFTVVKYHRLSVTFSFSLLQW